MQDKKYGTPFLSFVLFFPPFSLDVIFCSLTNIYLLMHGTIRKFISHVRETQYVDVPIPLPHEVYMMVSVFLFVVVSPHFCNVL